MSLRKFSLTLAVASTLLVSAIMAAPALAGGSTLTPKQLLEESALVTLSQRSMHFTAHFQVADTTKTKNFRLWARATSFVKGDEAATIPRSVRIHGEVAVPGRTFWFTALDKGTKGAYRLGQHKWTCGSIAPTIGSSSGPGTTSVPPVKGSAALERWLKSLGKKVKWTLTDSTLHGSLVYVVGIALHTRLNLQPIEKILEENVSTTTTSALSDSQRKAVTLAVKLPRPWVTMTGAFMIDPLNFALVQTDFGLQVAGNTTKVAFKAETTESNFGEKVAVTLPSACA